MRPVIGDRTAPNSRRRPRLAYAAVLVTGLLCLAAIVLRAPLRARYWAWRLARSDDVALRAGWSAALANLGDDGRWGITALLADPQPETRQYGVLVLHHVKTSWARQNLLAALADPDPGTARLAAVGLAIHGDDSVVPTLQWTYQTGDAAAAATACLALERLGTRTAIAALVELTYEPAGVEQRAALVDALAELAVPACVPGLEQLLSDDRASTAPPLAAETARRALAALAAQGRTERPGLSPSTQARPRTIAERAADALQRINRPPSRSAAESGAPHASDTDSVGRRSSGPTSEATRGRP